MSGDFTFLASDRVLLLSRRGWEEPPHIICIWNTNHSANITIYGMSSFFIKDFFEEKTLRLCVREILVMNRGQRSKFQSEKLLSCIVCSQKSKFQSEKLLLCIVVKSQNFRRRNYCYVLCLKVKISLWEIMVMHRVPRSKFLVWEIIVMCNLNVLCIGSAYSIATVFTIFNPLVTFANFFQPI